MKALRILAVCLSVVSYGNKIDGTLGYYYLMKIDASYTRLFHISNTQKKYYSHEITNVLELNQEDLIELTNLRLSQANQSRRFLKNENISS